MYLIIILVVMFADIGLAIWGSISSGSLSLLEAILYPILVLLYVLLMIGLLDIILRIFPKSMYDYKKRYFKTGKKELRFYEKIGIRKWKNKVPELGATGGFSKRNLQSLSTDYIEKFIYETCFGEILHLLAGILGFTCLFFYPAHCIYFILPILITNLILNLLPCFIQRYNRHKLIVVYNYLKRKEQKSLTDNVLGNISEDDEIQEENA